MKFFSQLRLLLWKNTLLKRRNVCSSSSELLLPLLFVFLLIYLQTLDNDSFVPERDWTCPTQPAFTPSLFSSPLLEEKRKKSKKNDDFFFSIDTTGFGIGVQTVPPLAYVLALCSKTESRIAFVGDELVVRNKFVKLLDEMSVGFEGSRWEGVNAVMDEVLNVTLCRFRRYAVFFNSTQELDEYVVGDEYGVGEWRGDGVGREGMRQDRLGQDEDRLGQDEDRLNPLERDGNLERNGGLERDDFPGNLDLHRENLGFAQENPESFAQTKPRKWRDRCPEMVKDYRVSKPKLYAAVVMRGENEYEIRSNVSVIPITYPKVGLVDPLLVGADGQFQTEYFMSGFLTLQLQIDRLIINKKVLRENELFGEDDAIPMDERLQSKDFVYEALFGSAATPDTPTEEFLPPPPFSKRAAQKRKLHDMAIHSICDSIQPLIRDLSKAMGKPELPHKLNCVRAMRTLALAGLDMKPLVAPINYIPNQVRVAPFPTPTYVDRPFYAKVQDVMSLVLLLCYLWPTSRLIRGIVHEKESRLKESMLQMGFSSTAVMASWLVTYCLIFGVIALLITIFTRFNVFKESDASCVFAFFFLFGCDIVAYSFAVSSIFDRAKTASTAGTALFFITYMPFFAVDNPNAPASSKRAAAIFAPTAFGIGTTVLAHYEASGTGIHWYNAGTAPAENDVSFVTILFHFIVDFFVYIFLGWYLQQVVPSEFGVAKPWYFLCSWRYWSRSRTKKNTPAAYAQVVDDDIADIDLETLENDASFFEHQTSAELLRLEREEKYVKVCGLRKVFDTPTGQVKVALHGLNAKFYQGQIFVLLAQNGGGKTTTLKMMTGDLAPTKGTARVFGLDLHKDMDEIRKNMGVCPQHDCLWDDLTVCEHLEFVGAQKGLKSPKLEEQVKEHISMLGLNPKTNSKSSTLSGGQKRKLGLAMALIGDSKLVFLDEPTSGMDVHSRRFVWNLLQASKPGRTIVLTTHFLDEADFLGDVIGIMAEGRMKCLGSSHFLKQKYGVGYTLTLVEKNEGAGAGTVAAAAAAASPAAQTVTKHLPQAKILSAMGSETSYQVPFEAASKFPDLFRELEVLKTQNMLGGYGVSVTTLDEVFVKVALNHNAGLAKAEQDRMDHRGGGGGAGAPALSPQADAAVIAIGTTTGTTSPSTTTSSPLINVRPSNFQTQFSALFKKRALYARRDKKSVCCNTLVPVALLVIGLGMLKAFPLPQPPPLQLTERDALQLKTVPTQVNIDSTFFTPQQQQYNNEFLNQFASLVPGGKYIQEYGSDFVVDPNNCTQDEDGNEYVDAFGMKRLSTYLRVDRFHRRNDSHPRFGAIHFDFDGNHEYKLDSVLSATIFANSSAFHSSALYMNVMNQGLLRAAANDPTLTLKITNAPFKFTAKFQELVGTFSAISASMSIIIAFSFVPATVAVFVVREREIAAKHQQLLAGTSLFAYWTSNYVFDVLSFVVPWFAGLICVWAFGIDAFNHGEALLAVAALFAAYGLAVVPFTYVASFFFESHSTAQNVVLLLNFITGLVLMITSFIMSLIENTYKVNRVLEYFYRIFPGFCLGNGLLNLTINKSKKTFGDGVFIKAESAFAWDVIGCDLFYLVFESFAYLLLTWVLDMLWSDPFAKSKFDGFVKEWKCWGRRGEAVTSSGAAASTSITMHTTPLLGGLRAGGSGGGGMSSSVLDLSGGGSVQRQRSFALNRPREAIVDEDVLREIGRIDSQDTADDVVVVKHLTKVYESTGYVAVKDLTFGIKRGDVFALLGVNGAGKSSALKMLTGDALPTSGTADIDGWDILLHQNRVRRLIGYCPQFDALLELLTPREHLELFGRLKGIPEGEALEHEVRRLLVELRLEEYEHRLAGTLSGGNKRKLSVAVALIGDPTLIVTDECTTGVDTLNRRFLCDVLADYGSRKRKGAVLMTTHSMEEVEALATKVGILSGGEMVCIGSIQHLKNRFGKGIMFHVRLASPSINRVDEILNRLGTDELVDDNALRMACARLGNPNRFEKITMDDPSGWIVRSALERDNSVESRAFASWWVAQDDGEKFEQFVHSTFSKSECLERRFGQFTYRVPELDPGMDLPACFALFELSKTEFHVVEYSVSGTSLESIFIALAKQTVGT